MRPPTIRRGLRSNMDLPCNHRIFPDPFARPLDLVEAIRDNDYACLTLATDQGTALLAKLQAREIEGLRGTFPIQLRHELFGHPASPIIRITATLYDDPTQPFLLETFINVDDDYQRADFAAFAGQEDLPVLQSPDRDRYPNVREPDPSPIDAARPNARQPWRRTREPRHTRSVKTGCTR
jgi:hypothetical protein